MDPVIDSLIAGFPVLTLHFLVTALILAAGVCVYMAVTPYPEIKLIKAGNLAAAVSLAAAVLGLSIPLAVCLASSVSVMDILVWGFVTLVIQLLVYYFVDWVLRDLPRRIEAGELGPAILLASIKLSVALLNAAAISG